MGKSRLAAALSEDQRIELNRRMLASTVRRLQRVKAIEHVLVVSRDGEALSVARECGARTLLEDGKPDLNLALTRASLLAKAYGVHGVLIVPSDLPLMDPADIEQMVSRLAGQDGVIIAPDHRSDGTNAMLIAPPDAIPFDYGPKSFERHSAHAEANSLRFEVYQSRTLSLDVDWPEDLDLLDQTLNFDLETDTPGIQISL
jgi:2-phospho-L-lactate guanylyltransferase